MDDDIAAANLEYPTVPPTATLGRRIAVKSLSGGLALPLNVLLQAMVPRALGAAAYGDYVYLSAFFTSVLNLGDSGTSQAFYNKLSQRPDEAGLSGFYARFALALLILLAAVVGLAFAAGGAPFLWPHLPVALVLLGALMAFGNWLISVASRAVDANALTVYGEAMAIGVRVALVLAVVVLFGARLLTLWSFFSVQNAFNLVLVAGLLAILGKAGRARAFIRPLAPIDRHRYTREFWDYCHPILVVSIAAAVADVADRWLLQRLGGSTQQGFLGLGLQIGSVVFIFGGATATLLAREFARAHHDGDHEQLKSNFVRYLPRAYTVTAYFGVFLAVESPAIVRLFGGDQFVNAAPATALLCLYPLHQVYGQLGNSLMYATERTQTVRSIGLAGLALGLLMTAFVLAPRHFGGLGLGAIGLAGKMVLHQIVIVNVILWSNARYLGVKFGPLLWRQLVTPVSFGICAFASGALAARAFPATIVASFLAAGVMYTMLASALALIWPSALGLEREDVAIIVRAIRTRGRREPAD